MTDKRFSDENLEQVASDLFSAYKNMEINRDELGIALEHLEALQDMAEEVFRRYSNEEFRNDLGRT